jgi:peptide chain release factor
MAMSTILICVTAGRGPAECRAAVAKVVEALQREASTAGVDCAAEANPEADKPSVLVSLGGEGAAALLRGWEGTVQCVADSRSRPHHRRRNWFVAVHRVAEPPPMPNLLPGDLVFETMRAGGPGGQHQNRTESAVRVTHKPTGASAIARDDRSQHRNRVLAVARLRAVLAGMREREANAGRFREWLARIQVERGHPVRVM